MNCYTVYSIRYTLLYGVNKIDGKIIIDVICYHMPLSTFYCSDNDNHYNTIKINKT